MQVISQMEQLACICKYPMETSIFQVFVQKTMHQGSHINKMNRIYLVACMYDCHAVSCYRVRDAN